MNLSLNLKPVGLLLIKYRKRREMSQKEVAHKLGYSSPQFISNIERGVCAIPPSVLRELVRLYKLNSIERKHMLKVIVGQFESALKKSIN